MEWTRMLGYVTGTVQREVLKRNEYLAAENRVLRSNVKGRVRLTDGERRTLAKIGKALGRKSLEEIATIVTPETILKWHRKLVARKFTPKKRSRVGRPPISKETQAVIVRLARENRTWGYDRIVGAMANLGYSVSAQSVANILKRHDLEPVPTRRKGTTWAEFVRSHKAVLAASDFFTAEVWTAHGLVTYYVLFFIELATRRVSIAGMTVNPTEGWMGQMARNATMSGWGFLADSCEYLIHDRDSKYAEKFREILKQAGIKPLALPPRSPNLNAYAERFVRSVKEECLAKLILFGEGSLRKVLEEYAEHYHAERNHQGRDNQIIQPCSEDRIGSTEGKIRRRARLGGLLNFYHRRAG